MLLALLDELDGHGVEVKEEQTVLARGAIAHLAHERGGLVVDGEPGHRPQATRAHRGRQATAAAAAAACTTTTASVSAGAAATALPPAALAAGGETATLMQQPTTTTT